MGETRKIAAILVADVVGYSRLAGADEDRTLARLRGLRSDLIDPTIAVHNGRVFKRTGDGSLVEFRSVVDAVRCAIEVQNGLVERNAGVPAERRIEFRVGIHLGDVVEESDGDLMGDGVNIAARLVSIATPARTLHEFGVKPDDDVGALHAGYRRASLACDQCQLAVARVVQQFVVIRGAVLVSDRVGALVDVMPPLRAGIGLLGTHGRSTFLLGKRRRHAQEHLTSALLARGHRFHSLVPPAHETSQPARHLC